MFITLTLVLIYERVVNRTNTIKKENNALEMNDHHLHTKQHPYLKTIEHEKDDD